MSRSAAATATSGSGKSPTGPENPEPAIAERAIPIVLLGCSGRLIRCIAVGRVFVEHLDLDVLVRLAVLAELVSD
jgi:hypothetical protein